MTTLQAGMARGYIEDLLRTGLLLTDLLADLLEAGPADMDGEPFEDVLIDMVVGSATPALRVAGEAGVAAAQALMTGVVDCLLADLRAAVEVSTCEV
jgi:hypothetical protein